jgi:hypothetical protein
MKINFRETKVLKFKAHQISGMNLETIRNLIDFSSIQKVFKFLTIFFRIFQNIALKTSNNSLKFCLNFHSKENHSEKNNTDEKQSGKSFPHFPSILLTEFFIGGKLTTFFSLPERKKH